MRAQGRANATECERVLLKAANNAADSLGRTRAPGDITPADVVKFVSTFYKAGHRGAADKARGYLAATFAWAIKSANDYTVDARQDWGVLMNPAAAVAKDHGAITVRDRNLSADEIRILWVSASEGNAGFLEGVEACIKTMIACGQRVQETLRMEGREIDVKSATWHMPADKTKGRKTAHTVPLPACILPDLRLLISVNGDGPLFPIRTTGKTGARMAPYTEAAAAWMAAQPRRKGKAWLKKPRQLVDDMQALFTLAKVEQIDNGARHSFISYRTAETRDVARVADECGNSVSTIKNHYRQLVRAEAAKVFFAIRPEKKTGRKPKIVNIEDGRASA
jgi:integrase